jgi:hypothetical protein
MKEDKKFLELHMWAIWICTLVLFQGLIRCDYWHQRAHERMEADAKGKKP